MGHTDIDALTPVLEYWLGEGPPEESEINSPLPSLQSGIRSPPDDSWEMADPDEADVHDAENDAGRQRGRGAQGVAPCATAIMGHPPCSPSTPSPGPSNPVATARTAGQMTPRRAPMALESHTGDHWAIVNPAILGQDVLRPPHFAKAWARLPKPLREALEDEDITNDRCDALLIAEDLEDNNDRWLASAFVLTPLSQRCVNTVPALEEALRTLIREAGRVNGFADFPLDLLAEAAKKPRPTPCIDLSDLPARLLTQWRTLTPTKLAQAAGKSVVPETMQEIESNLRTIWRKRIMRRLRPYSTSFSNMTLALSESDPEAALLDIFGTTRWSSLSGHGRTLDQMIDMLPGFLPWDTQKIANLFNSMRAKNSTSDAHYSPNKPMQFWRTILYLSRVCGMITPLNVDYLRAKRDSVRLAFINSTDIMDCRAPAPDIEVIVALEKATVHAKTPLDRWAASGFRHEVGASGRQNDYQHSNPDTHISTAKTSEITAWQTKVSDLLDRKREMPLIAPKTTFSGIEWWLTWEEGLEWLAKLLGPRDYIFPTPNRSRTGVKPTPLKSGTAIKWYRDLLIAGGLDRAKAMLQTLSGLRVFMPEQAYQAGISRDKRRYLGRWMKEDTADIYTRDHRHVVTAIWEEVCNAPAPASSNAPVKMVPAELTHAYWDLPKTDKDVEELPDSRIPLSGPCINADGTITEGMTYWDRSKEKKKTSGPGTSVPPASPSPPPLPSACATARKRGAEGVEGTSGDDIASIPTTESIRRRSAICLAADLVPPPKGPLELLGNLKPTGLPNVRKCHLRSVRTGTCLCGYPYKPENIVPYGVAADWAREYQEYTACDLCFRSYDCPTGWPAPRFKTQRPAPSTPTIPSTSLEAVGSTDSSDDGSNSDEDSDTDGEAIPVTA